MDYQKYIGQKILNKSKQEGIVTAFVEERITVNFNGEEKVFNPKVAFTNHFLSFTNDKFNHEMDDEYIEKEKSVIKNQEKAHEIAITRHKRVNQIYKKLEKKNKVLKRLFGSDFVYPPFEEFKKQYRLILDKGDDLFSMLFRRIDCSWKYW